MRRDRRAIERFAGGIAVLAIDLLIGNLRATASSRAVLSRPNLLVTTLADLTIDLFALAVLTRGLVGLIDAIVRVIAIAQRLALAVLPDITATTALTIAQIVGA